MTRRIKVTTEAGKQLLKWCRYGEECDCPVHHEAINGGIRAIEEEAYKRGKEGPKEGVDEL